MARRTLLLLAAVVVAAVGTGLIFVYVNGVNDRAVADQSPQKVLVAKSQIAAGTTAADAAKAGAFELRTVAKNSVAPGALSDITPIANEIALSTVFPGQQILAAQFGASGSTSSLPIPADKIAISVQLNDPARVAGFVQPGSNVAVFLTADSTGTTGLGNFTRMLLSKVQVVAVGPTTTTSQTSTDTQTGQTNTEQISRAILTLALSQQEAQKVIYASNNGSLSFGLLTSNSKVKPDKGVDAHNLFS
jgi:pilus assembly protein CpaB